MTETNKAPTNWRSFLQDENNKTELFHVIEDKLCEAETASMVVVTKEDTISNKMMSLDAAAPCSHEEANTRIFVHA